VRHLDLREFINSFPRGQRMNVRRRIARAHGVAEVTVRAWANGTRNHPFTLLSVHITESLTEGKVTRHDLRPDIFGDSKSRRSRRS
jgi:DNA-binding transcriptional regulator YdaS (Cro superfamily)